MFSFISKITIPISSQKLILCAIIYILGFTPFILLSTDLLLLRPPQIQIYYTIIICWVALFWTIFSLPFEKLLRLVSLILIILNIKLIDSASIGYDGFILNLYIDFHLIILISVLYITIRDILQIFEKPKIQISNPIESKKDIMILVILILLIVTTLIVVPIQIESNRYIGDPDATVSVDQEISDSENKRYDMTVTVIQLDYADYLIVKEKNKNNKVKPVLKQKTPYETNYTSDLPLDSEFARNDDKSAILTSPGDKAIIQNLTLNNSVYIYSVKHPPETTSKKILEFLQLDDYIKNPSKERTHILKVVE